jgi:hypothetical protein
MSTQNLRVHLGCFDQPFSGWHNTDISSHIWLGRIPLGPYLALKLGKISHQQYLNHRAGIWRTVRRLNVTRRFPFPSDSVSCFYTSHMLEHLFYDECVHCLREIFRSLVPGGLLRLSVPDLDKYIADYKPNEAEAFCRGIYESAQRTDKNRHHWMYNEQSMSSILKNLGFSKITRRTFKNGECPDIEKYETRPESLFLEATK